MPLCREIAAFNQMCAAESAHGAEFDSLAPVFGGSLRLRIAEGTCLNSAINKEP